MTSQTDLPTSSLPPLPESGSSVKRKRSKSIASSTSSRTSKKRKENIEEPAPAEAANPRRMLFQTRLNFPNDPLVALTPEETPRKAKKLNNQHPCFSSQAKAVEIPASPPRRESLADFRLSNSPRKRTAISSMVCTSLRSE